MTNGSGDGIGPGLSDAARWETYHRQVDRLRERGDRLGVRRLDIALAITALLLLAITTAFLADKGLSFAILDRSADVAVNALTLLAAGSVAALALARYREAGRLAGLYQASAFTLVAWISLLNISIEVQKIEGQFGLSLGSPEQLPPYIASITSLIATSLLVVGGGAAVSAVRGHPRTRRTLLIPSAVVTVVLLVVYLIRDQIPTFDTLLPAFVGAAGVKQMITQPRFPGPMPDVTGIALILQAVTATLFLIGVVLYRRSYLRDGPVADGYLAVAMLVGAFAQIHFFFYPGPYTSLVTTSDMLQLAFFVVLLAGIYAESRSDLRALRSAYSALDRLRLSEAERATLEERTRLARELHDGLAQDLWFAKLKHERLVPYVPDDQKDLAHEVTQALDSAIDEAKQAMVTMRAGDDRDRPLEELMSRAIDDFAARSGVRADFSAADMPTSLPARTQVEVMRVLQEALTHVRKHADATVVRVTADADDSSLHLSIVDNGRGFRTDDSPGDGLGLQGMKERARLMGGELHLMSEPSGGTTVDLVVPTRANVS